MKRKTLKKVFASALAAATLLTAAGCGGTADKPADGQEDASGDS